MTSRHARELTPAVQELNELFRQGEQKLLWDSKSACARIIGEGRRSFSGMTNGEKADGEVEKISSKIRSLLGGDTQPQSESSHFSTDFDHYYRLGVSQGLWKDITGCAEALEFSRGTVRKYRETPKETLCSSAKGQTTYEATIKKIKTYIKKHSSQSSDSLEEVSVNVPDAVPVQSTHAPQTLPFSDLSSLPVIFSQPVVNRIDALESRLPAMMKDAISAHQPETFPEGVIPSKWANEIVSGRMEIAEQNLPNVRFVVTHETVRKLLTSFRGEEVQDTKAYTTLLANAVAELRRRLTLIPQQEHAANHASAVKELVPELSKVIRELIALALTIEEIRECDVDKALKRAAMSFDAHSQIFSAHKP